MISIEVIRRYPFFSDLDLNQLGVLARAAKEISLEAGEQVFPENEELQYFYFVLDGKVDIVIRAPRMYHGGNGHERAKALEGPPSIEDISMCTIGRGEMFGWSALVPPHQATAGAIARTDCRVIKFDYQVLATAFEDDHHLAYLMALKAAQTIRERLHSLQIETLSMVPA